MKTGFRGTFVISWSQTEIDGLEAAPVHNLQQGAAWAWRGETIRVDGPNDVLRLDRASGADTLRKRAARKVQRLVGAALETERDVPPHLAEEDALPLMDRSFVVTDGRQSFTVTLIDAGFGRPPLLMFHDDMPPRDTELWVVHHALGQLPREDSAGQAGGVICFTPGTRIATPRGLRRIELLAEGDLVQTKDSGAQPIRWIGSRRMTGARLFAMPRLRPIRIAADFFKTDVPDADLIVSPDHRILVSGDKARDLFNTPEVLVRARDLIDGQHVSVEMGLREVRYVHLLLDSHQVVWANGVETESFHPASAALSALEPSDRSRLLSTRPELEFDPFAYGSPARRYLSQSEAAILQHAA